MAITNCAVAPDAILDRVRVRALCDHWFGPYYEPGFMVPRVPEGEWDEIRDWRPHLLPFDQTYQLPEHDQAYDPPRIECGIPTVRTVTVVYDNRGAAATYGVRPDGTLDLWMD